MKKLLMSAAFVAAAIVGSAAPSFAITAPGGTLGTFPNPAEGNQADFASGALTAGTPYQHMYFFGLTQQAQLERATASDASGGNAGLTSLSVHVAATNAAVSTGQQLAGLFQLQVATMLAAGEYYLQATGQAVQNGAKYTGNIFFAFNNAPPNAVPLPGALVLMGTVLAGGAGFGAMRKRAKKASALQAA